MIFFINDKFVKNNKILNILYINNRLCFYYKYKIQKIMNIFNMFINNNIYDDNNTKEKQ